MSVRHIDYIKVNSSNYLIVEVRPLQCYISTSNGMRRTAKWMTFDHWKELHFLLSDVTSLYEKSEFEFRKEKCYEHNMKDGNLIEIGYMFVEQTCQCCLLVPENCDPWTDRNQVSDVEDCKYKACGERLVVSVCLRNQQFPGYKNLPRTLNDAFSIENALSDYLRTSEKSCIFIEPPLYVHRNEPDKPGDKIGRIPEEKSYDNEDIFNADWIKDELRSNSPLLNGRSEISASVELHGIYDIDRSLRYGHYCLTNDIKKENEFLDDNEMRKENELEKRNEFLDSEMEIVKYEHAIEDFDREIPISYSQGDEDLLHNYEAEKLNCSVGDFGCGSSSIEGSALGSSSVYSEEEYEICRSLKCKERNSLIEKDDILSQEMKNLNKSKADPDDDFEVYDSSSIDIDLPSLDVSSQVKSKILDSYAEDNCSDNVESMTNCHLKDTLDASVPLNNPCNSISLSPVLKRGSLRGRRKAKSSKIQFLFGNGKSAVNENSIGSNLLCKEREHNVDFGEYVPSLQTSVIAAEYKQLSFPEYIPSPICKKGPHGLCNKEEENIKTAKNVNDDDLLNTLVENEKESLGKPSENESEGLRRRSKRLQGRDMSKFYIGSENWLLSEDTSSSDDEERTVRKRKLKKKRMKRVDKEMNNVSSKNLESANINPPKNVKGHKRVYKKNQDNKSKYLKTINDNQDCSTSKMKEKFSQYFERGVAKENVTEKKVEMAGGEYRKKTGSNRGRRKGKIREPEHIREGRIFLREILKQQEEDRKRMLEDSPLLDTVSETQLLDNNCDSEKTKKGAKPKKLKEYFEKGCKKEKVVTEKKAKVASEDYRNKTGSSRGRSSSRGRRKGKLYEPEHIREGRIFLRELLKQAEEERIRKLEDDLVTGTGSETWLLDSNCDDYNAKKDTEPKNLQEESEKYPHKNTNSKSIQALRVDVPKSQSSVHCENKKTTKAMKKVGYEKLKQKKEKDSSGGSNVRELKCDKKQKTKKSKTLKVKDSQESKGKKRVNNDTKRMSIDMFADTTTDTLESMELDESWGHSETQAEEYTSIITKDAERNADWLFTVTAPDPHIEHLKSCKSILTGITLSELSERVEEYQEYLKDLINGRIFSFRHKMYQERSLAYENMLNVEIIAVFGEEQSEHVIEVMNKIYLKKLEYAIENVCQRRRYIWKVLVPSFLIKITMDFLEISSEKEAEKKLKEICFKVPDTY